MLSRRILTPRWSSQPLTRFCASRSAATQVRFVSQSQAEIEDPEMNGGYVNPPAQKRVNRDPYSNWWDEQDRRNFGEPVHEDNDIYTIFSTHPYNQFKPAKAWFLLGCSVTTVLALSGAVSFIYPDKPSIPRTFEGGLETELGGPGALPVGGPTRFYSEPD